MEAQKHHPPRDSALIAEIGRAIHGDTWKQGLAEALDVSASALYAQARDKRTVTPAMRKKLLDYVRAQPERLASKLAQDLALMRRIEADLVAKGDTVDEKLPND